MISSNKLSKEIICNKLKAVPSPSCPLSFFLKHRSMLLLSTVFSSRKRSQIQEFLFSSLAREDFKKFILAWKLLLKVQPRKRDSNKNIKGLTFWGEISPQLYSYDCNGRNLHMNILHLSTYFLDIFSSSLVDGRIEHWNDKIFFWHNFLNVEKERRFRNLFSYAFFSTAEQRRRKNEIPICLSHEQSHNSLFC